MVIGRFLNGIGFLTGHKTADLTQELINDHWYEMPNILLHRPKRENGAIVEGSTAQELTDITEAQTQQTEIANFNKELSDGLTSSKELVVFIKRLGLTDAQLLNAKKTLLPVYKALKDGMWDLAKEEIANITRPAGAFGTAYDKIKTKIDNY